MIVWNLQVTPPSFDFSHFYQKLLGSVETLRGSELLRRPCVKAFSAPLTFSRYLPELKRHSEGLSDRQRHSLRLQTKRSRKVTVNMEVPSLFQLR